MAGNIEWLKRRQKGIGASDVPTIILGKVFTSTPMDIYASKRCEITEEQPENDHTRRGHIYEELAGRLYKEAYPDAPAHFPQSQDDHEADDRWHIAHHAYPHRRVNFDGLQEDGWVLEIKSPIQMVCDRIEKEGLRDYYQIQAMFQAGIAWDCGCFAFEKHQCKGTKVIVFHPEKAKITVVDVPIDHDFLRVINESVDRFWAEHVLAGVPPIEWANPVQPEKVTNASAYVPLDGEALAEVELNFALMSERKKRIERKIEAAKKDLSDVMHAAGVTKAVFPHGTKVICQEQPGRKTLKVDALLADHPEIDLEKYKEQGKPFEMLRTYPARGAVVNDDSAEDMAVEIGEELDAFARKAMDMEAASMLLDSLRDRADLHMRSLDLERQALLNSLTKAEESMVSRTIGGSK